MSLTNRVAIITGGARGIGQGIAWELARAGADVVFCDICSEADAAATLQGIRETGRRGEFHRADVSDRSAVDALVNAVVASFGRIDILVNNASVNIRKPLIDLEVSDVEKVWAVGLWGAFHCTQAVARQMVKQRSGNLVMISSVHALMPFRNNTAYNGTKAAINQMARTWAGELAPYGIRVNVVEPGWTDTPGERDFYTEEQIAELGPKLPLGRLAKPSEIGAAVRFLVSDEAAYMTGSCVRVDGGLVLPR